LIPPALIRAANAEIAENSNGYERWHFLCLPSDRSACQGKF
jgi:hypothetical protein